MAWTFWMPSPPTNLSGTLVAGGTLDANTTYYFKVFAWDQGNTTTSRSSTGLSQGTPSLFSPYSDTFSITTDATNRSVQLTWDQVMKRNGITQVDAYEVMISTSDNFTTASDAAKFVPSQVSYYNCAASTNSLLVTTKMGAYSIKNTKDGMPLFEWDGISSGTSFEALFAALKADATYNIFARSLTSFNDPTDHYIYQFMGKITVARYSGDSTAGVYSFTSLGNIIQINGYLYVSGKMNIQGNLISVNGQSHCNSGYNYYAGSIVKDNFFRGGIKYYSGKSYQPFASGGSSFNLGSTTSTITNNFNQITENDGEGLVSPDSFFSSPIFYSATVGGSHSSATRLRTDSRRAGLSTYIDQSVSGLPKKVFLSDPAYTNYPDGFNWSNEHVYNSSSALTNATNAIGTGLYDSSFVYPTFRGWDVYPAFTRMSQIVFLGKTIRVKVVDKNNNPLQGAKVSFYSANGINLTKGNNAATIAKVVGAGVSAGNNYDGTEVTIPHTTPNITVRETTGTYGYNQLKENTKYWYRGEKIEILARGAAAAWDGNVRHFTSNRGLEGTITGWILGGGGNYTEQFFEALDYVETDINGFTWNGVVCRTYRSLKAYSGLLSKAVSASNAVFVDHFPLKVEITYPGKQTRSILITESTAINSGILPITLDVNMDDGVSIYTLVGDDVKQVINSNPSSSTNDILLDVVE